MERSDEECQQACCICCKTREGLCGANDLKICSRHKKALEDQLLDAEYWRHALQRSEERLAQFEKLKAPEQLIADEKDLVVRMRLKVQAFDNRG